MRKRLTFLIGVVVAVISGVYLMSPLLAAHKLRQAVKTNNTQRLANMVEWPSVRDSIRSTIVKNAKLLPIAKEMASGVRPTMWQRIRSVFGHSMLDRFIENYITPEGLPKLYHAKNKWHGSGHKAPPTPTLQASIIPTQFANAWRRVKRAEFKSPFRFVLEVQDRHVATRLIKSTFQLSSISLSGFDWKLVAISIRNLDANRTNLVQLNGF